MADLVNLAIKVSTDEIEKAHKGLNTLQKELEKTESIGYKFGYAIGTAAKAAATAVVGLVGTISTLTLAFAKQIDDLQDLADMYGYSATQVSVMKRAAEDAGATFEDVVKATNKARLEVSKGGEAFKNLGVNMRDTNGHMKTGAELATEVAEKYRAGQTTAAQYADVAKVLGKDVDKAAAALAAQRDAQELLNELQQKGIGIVEGSITATDAFSKAKARASAVMESAGSILVAKVLPAFTTLITALTDSYVNGGMVKQMFDGLIATMPALIDFGSYGAIAIGALWTGFKQLGITIGAVAAALVSMAQGNFGGVGAIFDSWKEDLKQSDTDWRNYFKNIVEGADKMKKAIADAKIGPVTSPGNDRNRGGPGQSDADKKAAEEKLRLLKAYNDELSRRGLAELKRQDERDAADDKHGKAMEKEAEAYRDMLDPVRKLNREIKEINDNLVLNADEKAAAIDKVTKAFEDQYKSTIKVNEEISLTERIGLTAFSGLEDALVQFAETGRINFKSLISSMLGDLMRLYVQMTIIKPLMSMFTGYMGGGVSGLQAAFSHTSIGGSGFGTGLAYGNMDLGGFFAGGGRPPKGRASVVGEQGPELFVPDTAGTIIPNHALGGSQQVNNITIVVQGGQTNAETGNAVSQAVLNTMRGIARKEIKSSTRTGGLLNPI